MAERSAEHWADFRSKKEDSHILKHWLLHHHGEGEPELRIKVIRFCRDAMSRQVGEAIMIVLRANCLNSQAGYNRSGISRLSLKEDDIQKTNTKDASEEYAGRLEDEGIEMMYKRKRECATTEKRKVNKRMERKEKKRN